MEQLYSIGLNNQEIVNMLEVNQEIRNVTNEEIKGLCDLLRFIGCKDYHVKNILIANPFYLTRSVEDVQKLIQKLESLGIVHLETTFDSNPWLFNKDAFEIDEYIEERMSAGVSLEEVIDEIDAGTLFLEKCEVIQKMIHKYMLSLGYTNDDITEILNSYSLCNLKEDTLYNNIVRIYAFLESLGYTQSEIIKMTKLLPALYSLSIENIKTKIEDLEQLGYTRPEIIKMTKVLPALYNYSIENIKTKIEDLEQLGYTQQDIIKMTKSLPALYGYSIENIKTKIEDLEQLGYTRPDIIKMTKSLPALYGLSIENIKTKIEDLEQLGYSRPEIIKMTKILPALYALSIENIRTKVEFMKEINLDFVILEDTKKMMQSVDLMYARYMFFKECGIEVNQDNYRKLFYNAKQFERQYEITKSEILEKYNYQKYKEEKNNGTAI